MSTAETYSQIPHLQGFSGEWETKRLEEIGEISGAGVDKKVNLNEVAVRLVNYLDVYNKTFLYSKDLTHEVSARPDQVRRCAIEKGDIFFTPSSEVPDDIGCSAVAMEDISDGVYSYHVVRLRLKTNWDLYFRAYAFDTKAFLDQASKQCEGSGTRYVISLPKFRAMTVQFPPTVEEQRAIAEALSDVDGLLNALDALIAKKQAIKQATRQQLLTGRTYLPGFSGAWQEKRIGDLFETKAGGDLVQSRFSDVQDSRYPHPIYANALEQRGLYGFSNYAEEPAGSITVTARGTLGQAFYRDAPFVAIGRLLVLKPKISLNARFFCEYINYGIHFAIESTGVPQLTAPQVSRYLLPVPPESEQNAIASVLSDMDSEIAALEQRWNKTRAIKQGMIQQLLTGRVRLCESRIYTDDTDYTD